MSSNRILMSLVFCSAVITISTESLDAANWYVRPDGGNRTQCTGKANAPYSGTGVNQPCAFKHPNYLFTTDPPTTVAATAPAWIIAGGDTVILRNGEYRIGYKTNNTNGFWNYVGCRGDTANCFNPMIPAGTPENPTRIVGEQWQSGCAVKAKLTGGVGVTTVLNLNGAKNVSIECVEISDFAQCGTGAIGPYDGCVRSGFPKSDYALRGLRTDLATDGLLLRNINIHGLAQMGIRGRIGGVITADNLRIAGIQGGGWDNDDGGGIHSTGKLVLRNSLIEWAGCLEEYPIKSQFPYYKCYDQSHGGYGDGLGILVGEGMRIEIDRSTFRYNVQDGVDLLYVHGVSPTVSVTHSRASGNGGQQWKFGPFKTVTFENNLTIANCRRFAEDFPGAPATYNDNITDFCRASDGMATTVADYTTINWFNNTTVGYTSVINDIICTKVIDTFNSTGRGGASPLDPSFRLDGVRRQFELSHIPVAFDIYSFQVNGARKAVGIQGVDTGKDWYWVKGTKTFVQSPTAVPLGAKDQLIVQYNGPGKCQNARFNYLNNIFRGYNRLDSGRIPTLFYFIGIDGKTVFNESARQRNLICGSNKPTLYWGETYLQSCPGNWLANEPVSFTRESDLDSLDLHLSPVSQARDGATSLPSVVDDYEGAPRFSGIGPDVGAYEIASIGPSESATVSLHVQRIQTKVTVAWLPVPSAWYYRIQRRYAHEPGKYYDMGQVSSNIYIDPMALLTRGYCYRIQPNNAISSGKWSAEACVSSYLTLRQ